jgi:hypothetical protein
MVVHFVSVVCVFFGQRVRNAWSVDLGRKWNQMMQYRVIIRRTCTVWLIYLNLTIYELNLLLRPVWLEQQLVRTKRERNLMILCVHSQQRCTISACAVLSRCAVYGIRYTVYRAQCTVYSIYIQYQLSVIRAGIRCRYPGTYPVSGKTVYGVHTPPLTWLANKQPMRHLSLSLT